MGIRTVCFVGAVVRRRRLAALGADRRRVVPAVRRGGDGQRRRPRVDGFELRRPARRPSSARRRRIRRIPGRRMTPDRGTIAREPGPPSVAEVPDSSPVAVRHRRMSGTRPEAPMTRPICSAKGCQAPAVVGAAVEQPEAAHARPAQDLAGLRRAPAVARRTSSAPAASCATSSRTAEARATGRAAADGGVSRRWPTSAGRAAGTSGRRCRGRAAWPPSRPPSGRRSPRRWRRPRSARAQVGLLAGEQAVADLAVGGEPDPVAVAAERPGDRGDHADRGRAAVDQEQLGRGAAPRLARPGVSVNSGSSCAKISSAVTISLAAPAVLGVERHLLDEPQLVAVLEAPAQQLGRLVVVDAAQQHGVDLDRAEPGVCGGLQAGEHVVEPVAPGDLRGTCSGRRCRG